MRPLDYLKGDIWQLQKSADESRRRALENKQAMPAKLSELPRQLATKALDASHAPGPECEER
jgi:hypothetical protein